MTSPPIRLLVCGRPNVTVGDGAQAPPSVMQPRRLAVLIYLTLARPRGMQARDTLIAMLWPEHDEVRAHHALRNVLHVMRRELGEDVIRGAGHGAVGINPERVTCDLLDLEAELAAGDFESAFDRYESEILQGLNIRGAPAFDEWIDGVRRRTRSALAAAARSRAAACRAHGDVSAAVQAATRACSIAPDDERLLRELVELLDASGDRAGALRAYSVFAERMRAEYESEPAPETMSLARRLRAGAPPTPTMDAHAYVLYVRGTWHFLRAAHGGYVEELQRCKELFEHSLQRDPRFALALAGLSNYYAAAAARNLIRPFHTHFEHAIALSHEALERDPSLAIPHVHFGVQAMYLESDWERAEREFGLSAALDPLYAEGRRFFGILHTIMGRRDEGLAELREAARLEPDIPMFRNSLADAYMMGEAWDEAAVELRHALELDPGYAAAHERLLRCLERLERFDEAVAVRQARNAAASLPFHEAFASAGADGYRAARRDELAAWLRSEEARLDAGPSTNAGDILNPPELRVAMGHAELGDPERAFAWEQRACRSAPGRRRWFLSRPELAAVEPFRRAERLR